MEDVLAGREAIAQAAHRYAPERRYWAIVGNGPNRIAAEELRIKLSELCYKAIACDSTEDKKHIDLSSEPMILVCATGLDSSTAGDVAKEVAIYRAHKAAPIVIATRGTSFPAALQTIEVPEVHPALAFVLSAMAGHLFGYEAALAIDAQALPLREVRANIEAVASSGNVAADPLTDLGPLAARAAAPFLAGLRGGAYNGHLEAATAVRLVQLLGYTTGTLPIEAYEATSGAFRKMMTTVSPDMFPGDPVRAAAAIYEVVASESPRHWVVLGSDAQRRIGAKLDMLRAEFEAGADTARSTDYPGSAKAIL